MVIGGLPCTRHCVILKNSHLITVCSTGFKIPRKHKTHWNTRIKKNFNQRKCNFKTESVIGNHNKDTKELGAWFSAFYVKIWQISITSKGKLHTCTPTPTHWQETKRKFPNPVSSSTPSEAALQRAFEGRSPTLPPGELILCSLTVIKNRKNPPPTLRKQKMWPPVRPWPINLLPSY